VQLAPEAMQQIEQRPRPRQIVAQHQEAAGAFATAPEAEPDPTEAPRAARSAEPSMAPARTGPRVGRNDPCPCGSGKKYKKCHMLIDEGVGTGA
jgi:preprotein translocase subunit SecA